MKKDFLRLRFLSFVCGCAVLATTGSACKFDEKDFDFSKIGVKDYEASWVANLVDAEVEIRDFVSDTTVNGFSLRTNPSDQRFLIAYELDYNTDSLDVMSWLKQDSIVGTDTFSISNPTFEMYSSTSFDVTLNLPFARIDTVYLKSGLMECLLSSPLEDTSCLSAEISTPAILELKDGILQPYVRKVSFGKNYIDLTDKYIIVSDTTVHIDLKYVSKPFTGSCADSSAITLKLDYVLRIPEFHYITGEVFRDTSMELVNGKYDFSLMADKLGLGLQLSDMTLHTDVETNVGIHLACELGRLKCYNNSTHQSYNFLSSEKYTFDVNYPTFRGQVTHTYDSLKINKDAVIGNVGYVDYAAYATLKKGRFFLDENARYDVKARIELPLDLTIEQFHYMDTLNFSSLSKIDETLGDDAWDYVKSVLLRYEFVNGIPLNLNVQVFFADTNFRVVDSLFADRSVLEGASVDPVTALVTAPRHSGPDFITFDKGRVSNLAKTRYLILDAAATTTQSKRVVLTADQTLRVRMGAKVNAKVNWHTK